MNNLQVYEEVDNCCAALSNRLDDQRFFFNNRYSFM